MQNNPCYQWKHCAHADGEHANCIVCSTNTDRKDLYTVLTGLVILHTKILISDHFIYLFDFPMNNATMERTLSALQIFFYFISFVCVK